LLFINYIINKIIILNFIFIDNLKEILINFRVNEFVFERFGANFLLVSNLKPVC